MWGIRKVCSARAGISLSDKYSVLTQSYQSQKNEEADKEAKIAAKTVFPAHGALPDLMPNFFCMESSGNAIMGHAMEKP